MIYKKKKPEICHAPNFMIYKTESYRALNTTLYKGKLLYKKVRECIECLNITKFKKDKKDFIYLDMPLDRKNSYKLLVRCSSAL